MKILSYIAVIGLIIGLIGSAIWWQVFRYQECKKVGHSKLYCVLQINSK